MLWLILALVLVPALARADVHGGWRFTAPEGYASTIDGNHIVIQKATGATFCQLNLYDLRRMTDTAEKEIAVEWKNVVERNFTASDVKAGSVGKSKTLEYLPISASAKIGASEFAIIHYIVMPPQAVSSVLLVSNNTASVAKCAAIAKTFIESLVVETQAPAATPTNTGGSVVGRWATSSSDSNTAGGGTTNGSTRRQYTFAADGTYRYHSESSGGTYRANDYRLVDEVGTFAVDGDTLTIDPKTATETLRSRDSEKTSKLALEKVSYRWQRHYFEGIKEWNLVLTVGKPTVRDGAFASNDRFPSSYLLSDTYKPDWKFPP
jgi:hypothetical protein